MIKRAGPLKREPALGQFMKILFMVYYALYNTNDIDFAEFVKFRIHMAKR